MKTSAVLASVLFGSFAVAAPFDKRALVYKTEVVTETLVVYTTVYEDEPVAQATTTPAGYFYEQPKVSSSAVVSPSSSSAQKPANTPPAPASSSSVYVAPPQAPASTPSPTPTPSPAPVNTPAPVYSPEPVASSKAVETPQPASTPSPVAPAPAPVSSASAAPANSPSTGGGSTTGQYSGDITIYEPNGGSGACGTSLSNDDLVVALSKDAWGASTYDVMTGAATNKWCNQKIQVFYQGRTVSATIMDMCPGCSGMDIDLSPAAWKQLTGSDEKTRYKATWSSA